MPRDEREELIDLVEMRNIDDLWAAVRLCHKLKSTEPDPGTLLAVATILEQIGNLWEAEPMPVEWWNRVPEQIVPVMRTAIRSPSPEAAADLLRRWTRLNQENPFR